MSDNMPLMCALGHENLKENTFNSGYAADTTSELIKMITDDGGCPTNYKFFYVGNPLKLVLMEV